MAVLPPEVLTWIYEQNPDVDDIDPDLDLFDSRLVNSLSLIEFVIVVEQASGRTIDRRNLQTEQFQTLRAIQENFFPGTASDAAGGASATAAGGAAAAPPRAG